ncbi:MAG: hypothetical protein JNK29_16200 [Anaerolineales bacterium]|nr:hypothetical protein [Anaerolineales bacterium]
MSTLTPADERGLSGLTLDSQLRQAFARLSPAEAADLVQAMHTEALRRKLIYMRENQAEVIPVLMRPTGILPDQLAYLHFVALTLINALKRLPDLYIQDFAVRSVVPLTPPEEKWLWDNWGPHHRENNPVFGRLDAVIDLTSPMWKDSLHFMEPNLSGVGGIHLIPNVEQLLADVVMPALARHAPGLRLEAGQDLRELFIQEVLDHLEALGRRGRNICFVEPKYSADGPVEQECLAEYYRDRYGLNIFHADPTELYLVDGEVMYQGRVVDVIYRDYEIRDMLYIEAEEGVDIRPLRQLFKQNRVISSLAGDFDHKSCWEILTDPQFTQKYFSADERQVFRRHVLWTRVVGDRRTSLPDGEMVNLLEYIRKEHELLVLKPNRSYGGDRVVIGPAVSQSEWEAALDEAVAGAEDPEEQWVVQRLTRLPVYEFPVVAEAGAVTAEPFYTVMGLAPTKYGLSVLGRASQKMVVNVAQRGGLCGVLVGRPAMRLMGPPAPQKVDEA